jgi:hypothetical protein
VAVLAYNRASGFTTDHEQVAVLLQRFRRSTNRSRRSCVRISAALPRYGSGDPRSIQTDIDAIFRGAAGVRQVPPGSVADAGRMRDDTSRGAEALMRADILAGRDVPPGNTGADRTFDLAAAERIDLPFDEYVEKNLQTMQDLGNLYTGIAYMRYLDGEKHLVFITERGLFLPRLEDDKSIAALANDSRVAIDVIQPRLSASVAADDDGNFGADRDGRCRRPTRRRCCAGISGDLAHDRRTTADRRPRTPRRGIVHAARSVDTLRLPARLLPVERVV